MTNAEKKIAALETELNKANFALAAAKAPVNETPPLGLGFKLFFI
jgi:hypothetical protein